jgi:hypothetical protein
VTPAHIIADRGEGYAYNIGFGKMGADGSRVSTFCFSILLLFRQDVINLAMCKSSTFIYKLFFGWPGGRKSISPTSPSRTVGRYAIGHPANFNG